MTPKKQEQGTIEQRLPELDEEMIEFATSKKTVDAFNRTISAHVNGWVEWLEKHGFALQRVAKDVFRCVAVCDSDKSYTLLQMFAYTCKEAGITLQIDPYTVIIYSFNLNEGEECDQSAEDKEGNERVVPAKTTMSRSADPFAMEVA